MRLFIDSSVLFAACYSHRGAARELIRLAITRQVTLCICEYVSAETEASITERASRALDMVHYLIARDFWEWVEVTHADVAAAIPATIDRFDAPIVAAAKRGRVDFLVSFDRKHLHTAAVEAYLGVPVVTPDIVLQRLRS